MTSGRYSVFFGDVAQDEYYRAPAFPAAGDKMIVEALPVQFGGSVANAAAMYAHHGHQTSFVAQLNSGALTQRLLAELALLGLDTSHVIFDETTPDSHCIVVLCGDEHIVLIPRLGIERTDITPGLYEHLAGAEFMVTTLTDARPFRMGGRRADQVLEMLRARGVAIVMDLDVYNEENHHAGLIEHCDILFMNTIGERRFIDSGEDIETVLRRGATAVVVTRDRDGCELFTRAGSTRIAGHLVDVVDVTGAGDTFSSSFLHAYSTTRDLVHAARFANAAAALSVTRVGARAGMTTSKAVDDLLMSKDAVR